MRKTSGTLGATRVNTRARKTTKREIEEGLGPLGGAPTSRLAKEVADQGEREEGE